MKVGFPSLIVKTTMMKTKVKKPEIIDSTRSRLTQLPKGKKSKMNFDDAIMYLGVRTR